MSVFEGSVCLDVTRTVSRAGAGAPSGVDRVERAYIREVLKADQPLFLSRVLGGFVLMDADAMRAFLDVADVPDALDKPDMLSQLARRQSTGQKRAESTVRRLGSSFARRSRLATLLMAAAPGGFDFLTVGHSNQSERVYTAVREAGARKIITLLHDVIPLDYPEFSRPTAVPRFAMQFKVMVQASDLLIFNSAYTEERAAHWMKEFNVDCSTVTTLLGCDPLPAPISGGASSSAHPAFVVIGTIEPRKNHLLLLNVWRRFYDTMALEDTPHLHIVGRRGWENENVIDALERAPFMGKTVFEHGFLTDTELGDLLHSAHALLFPSFVEGFGYPLIEALQMGKRTLCAPLPPFKEIAESAVTYIDPLDGLAWQNAILELAKQGDPHSVLQPALPSWNNHFRSVGQAISAQLHRQS